MTTWTNVSKASVVGWVNAAKPSSTVSSVIGAAGTPIGLLMALTYPTASSITTSLWTNVSKAGGTSWTNVTKAT